jgi:inverted formin-2
LDVFDEQQECDESQSLQGPDGINLNSHLDVFYAILRQVSDAARGFWARLDLIFSLFLAQVADKPQEIPFLNILQHLLSIEPKDAVSDIIWDTAETLVHRATLLETREDSTKLLRAPSVQKFSCPHCRGEVAGQNRKLSLPHTLPAITLTTQQSHPGAFAAAPPPANVPSAPPPPPPSGKPSIALSRFVAV